MGLRLRMFIGTALGYAGFGLKGLRRTFLQFSRTWALCGARFKLNQHSGSGPLLEALYSHFRAVLDFRASLGQLAQP